MELWRNSMEGTSGGHLMQAPAPSRVALELCKAAKGLVQPNSENVQNGNVGPSLFDSFGPSPSA